MSQEIRLWNNHSKHVSQTKTTSRKHANLLWSSSGTLYLRLALAYNQLHKNACKNKLFSYHLFRWLLIIWSLTGNECVPKCDIRWRLCRLIYPLHGRLEWFKTSVCLNTMALWSTRLSIQIRLWKNNISIKWVKN